MADPAPTTTVLSAGVGAAFGLLAAAAKSYLDSRRKIDEDLRARRETYYRDLWQKTRRFQLWPRTYVTYAEVTDFQLELANWYYEDGGLLLSRSGQSAYTRLQAELASVTGAGDQLRDADRMRTRIREAEWTAIREKCSSLRTSLTDDLLSRRSGRRII